MDFLHRLEIDIRNLDVPDVISEDFSTYSYEWGDVIEDHRVGS